MILPKTYAIVQLNCSKLTKTFFNIMENYIATCDMKIWV